jgi:hypothetical protein
MMSWILNFLTQVFFLCIALISSQSLRTKLCFYTVKPGRVFHAKNYKFKFFACKKRKKRVKIWFLVCHEKLMQLNEIFTKKTWKLVETRIERVNKQAIVCLL